MDVEMEDDISSGGDTAVEFTFTAVEIDIDYEFEAARFFDFTRTESIDEAIEAEMWFDSVESYPPSPFAVRLLSRGKSENANSSAASKGFDDNNQLDSASDVVRAPEDSLIEFSNTACTGQVVRCPQALTDTCLAHGDMANGGVPLDLKSYYLQQFHKQQTNSSIPKDSIRNAIYKSKTKSSWKPSLPRTSTLMKPTASQLAKQNQERVIDHFRFQKLGNNSSGVESQAAKRQKLEGGHLCKVTDTKQQTNLVHKAPKSVSCLNDGNLGHRRLRITVPRPPDLATAQRAQRIRQKGDDANEHVASRDPGFQSRPLNRKIFKAPSLLHQKRSNPELPEFQAPKKPSRAFGTESGSKESKGGVHKLLRPTEPSKQKQEDCETIHRFKALPLNKKIFSSKGDLGVFRSSKRETTVTMAFNFQTEKRAQHAPVPPVDLFNKLSLGAESGFRPSIFTKGSKENRVCSVQQQSEVNTPEPGSKQVHFANTITKGNPLSTIRRNLGTR